MSTDDDSTDVCPNCKKTIPAANFVMHVAYCNRNVQHCSVCGEPVAKIHAKDHFDSFHKMVECDQCGEQTSINKEMDHKHKCRKGQGHCKYCDLQFRRDKLDDHLKYCQSRTEKCPDCGKYIMLKYWENHDIRCEGQDKTKLTNKGEELTFDEEEGQYSYSTDDKPTTSSTKTIDGNIPCEFCNEDFPTDLLIHHQVCCPKNPYSDDFDVFSFSNTDNHVKITEIDDDSEHTMGKSSKNYTVQESEGSGDSARHESRKHARQKGQGQIVIEAVDTRDNIAAGSYYSNPDSAVITIPCEFCSELCPADKLMEHQQYCGIDDVDRSETPETPRSQFDFGGRMNQEGRSTRSRPRSSFTAHSFSDPLFERRFLREREFIDDPFQIIRQQIFGEQGDPFHDIFNIRRRMGNIHF